MFENMLGWMMGLNPLIGVAALLILAWVIFRLTRSTQARKKKRHVDTARQDAIEAAKLAMDHREQFEFTYHSGRYKHPKSIPRLLDPAFMTPKELARKDGGIGEFSSDERYLEPPDSAWD